MAEIVIREGGRYSKVGAAKLLGLHEHTVGDLVRLWQIRTHKTLGRAHGLDEEGLAQLRAGLGIPDPHDADGK